MSDNKYTLREVTDKQLEREFIHLPKRLYNGNPYWLCPLDDDIPGDFHTSKNKYYNDGAAILRIASIPNSVCGGRIAAF